MKKKSQRYEDGDLQKRASQNLSESKGVGKLYRKVPELGKMPVYGSKKRGKGLLG